MSGAGEAVLGSAFEGLGGAIRDALAERGFTEPTEPQRLAIPSIASGEHVLVIGPTGSGKTETAMLPVFDALTETAGEGIGCLYVTPLRALNRDMRSRLEWWGETLGLEVDVRHGDTSSYHRRQQADDPPDVLVTTPETLQAMLTGERLREGLANVEHVVVDEVHELAGSKRGAQLAVGIERLVELAGDVQRIGLSATVGDPEAIGAFLTGGQPCTSHTVDVGSRIEVAVETPEITAEDESLAGELVTEPRIASHVRRIVELVEANTSTLIFVNTRQTAEALGSRFRRVDAPIGVHHGSLSKQARIDVEDRFKSGELDALLCTSSMELGIDVGRIDHVIQYQSPRQVTRLLQRIGRAGHRVDEISRGTIIAGEPDDILESIAIVAAARDGEVEPARVHRGSLDTLANQVVGMVMDEGEIRGSRAYEVLSRAEPFADVTPDTVREVIEQLSRNRILWLDEEADTLSKTGDTWRYFYENLSMIPDEATYTVHDMAGGNQIGTLDERFVVNFAEPGEVFVQRGEMWRIVEIDEDRERVNVSPIEDPGGEVPSWTGQEIPVPEPIAQRVGRLRATIARGGDLETIRDRFPDVPVTEHTINRAREPIDSQVDDALPVPTDDRVVIEGTAQRIVVNACFGHRANDTLGRLLAALLGQRTGSAVGLDVDPYRIELEVPPRTSGTDVLEVLEETDADHVRPLIELSLKQSDALKFRVAQVATKFGALKRWRSSSSGLPPGRILEALTDTPIYAEAVRELIHEELDPDAAGAVLTAMRSGDLEVAVIGERTPIGMGGRTGVSELLSPEHADASVIKTVRERLQEDRVILCCIHCREWSRKTKVKRVDDQPSCPNCGSTRIAALNPWDDETVAAVRSDDRDDEQEDLARRAYKAANLVQSHGKQAVIALAARGVGPQNAARVIGKLREDEDAFYRDLLEQERQYARTRSFWD